MYKNAKSVIFRGISLKAVNFVVGIAAALSRNRFYPTLPMAVSDDDSINNELAFHCIKLSIVLSSRIGHVFF